MKRSPYLCHRNSNFNQQIKLKTMSVLIKPIQRANPADLDAPKKWYVTQVTISQVDENQISDEMAEGTTLDSSEAMMALRQFRKVLLKHLLAGESVKMGNWGSFSITLTSSGVDTKDKVTTNLIRNVNLNFQADKTFKDELQKANFVWVNKLAGEINDVMPAITSGRDGSTGTENSTGTRGSEYILKGTNIQLLDKDEEHKAAIRLINSLDVPTEPEVISTNTPDLIIFTIPIDLSEGPYTLELETYYTPNGMLDEPLVITAPFTLNLI